MIYPSDLSDAQWGKIALFFARPDPRGAREKYSKRRMAQAKAAYPDLESFTADQDFRRQAEKAAHALDCELHVTHKPKKRASR